MLVGVITSPSYEEALCQCHKALQMVDLLEIRIDSFASSAIGLALIAYVRKKYSIPLIGTVRTSIHGGLFRGGIEAYFDLLLQLGALGVDYIDIEDHLPDHLYSDFCQRFPKIKIILSHHSLSPKGIHVSSTYAKMRKKPAYVYKIATMALDTNDCLRMLLEASVASDRIAFMGLGELGKSSRMLSRIAGNFFTYAFVKDQQKEVEGTLYPNMLKNWKLDVAKAPAFTDQKKAPYLNTGPFLIDDRFEPSLTSKFSSSTSFGISAEDLLEVYRFRDQERTTAIVALIGSPVDKSIGPYTHNRLCKHFGINAVYVPLPIEALQIGPFLSIAKKLPFRGCSVTMPLKETICSYVDGVSFLSQRAGSVNTLYFEEGGILGDTTDGIGAYQAIVRACSIDGKRIVLLGTGGCARAVGQYIQSQGGTIVFVGRDPCKMALLAAEYRCHTYGFDTIERLLVDGYDCLINCTPLQMPIAEEYILPNRVVMDTTTVPMNTLFLQVARAKGCHIICGFEMFVEQASYQWALWYPQIASREEYRDFLFREALEIVHTNDS